MNMVERWVRELSVERIHRSFVRRVDKLIATIMGCVGQWNERGALTAFGTGWKSPAEVEQFSAEVERMTEQFRT